MPAIPLKRLKSWLHPLYQHFVSIPKIIREGTQRSLLEVRYVYNSLASDPHFQDSPVFIVGCGHSGTSLLLSILGSHPKLYDVPGESYFAFKDESEARSTLRRFRREAIATNCVRWVEKTPKHVRRVGTLLQHKPSSRVLVMLRDGRDVACSIRERTGDFQSAVERWVADNKRAEKHIGDKRVKRVKYEDLVQDFESTVRDICGFIGESYDPQMRQFHQRSRYYYDWRIRKPSNPEDHERLRNWQVNQPLFDGSGRWKEEMSEIERKTFKDIAGDMLIKYEYARNTSW